MKYKRVKELEEAKRQEFEKTFKPMIEPLKTLATIRMVKDQKVPVKFEALEPEEEKEDTFEDAAACELEEFSESVRHHLRITL